MDRQEKKKRIRGVLAGCACGDAMGMPTEGMSRKDIDSLFPQGVREFYGATERDIFGRKMRAGEITDDTINTVLIAQMLADTGGKPDTMRYLDYLRRWMKENPEKCRYVAGPNTLRALDALEKGTPLERAGIFGTTNGAAMKIGPVGIVSDYHDMQKLTDWVEQICKPTHNTSTAIAGAAAVAACVSYGIQGGNRPEELWDIALEAARAGSGRGYQSPAVSLMKRMEAVRALTETEERETVLEQLKNYYGTGVETIETIPAVLAIIQISGGDAWKASCISAELGGDTDTIGAVSASICGGMKPGLPEGVEEMLEQVNHLDFGAIAESLLPYAV